MTTKVAIIVGVNGQDGQLLKSSLERKGYSVIGIARKSVISSRTQEFAGKGEFSILNTDHVNRLICYSKPNEIYYLAGYNKSAQDDQFDNSPTDYYIFHEVHVLGLLNFLTAMKQHSPTSRLFYASTSHIFGRSVTGRQSETTSINPSGYYALTKCQGGLICRDFRERHGLFASVGILFSHESACRKNNYLSMKLIEAASQIAQGRHSSLRVGSLSATNDWGYAPDFVEAMYLILNSDRADDFVIATGVSHSVGEFADLVFAEFGLNFLDHIEEDRSVLMRQPVNFEGDTRKLFEATGWRPSRSFSSMVKVLVSDYKIQREERLLEKTEQIRLEPN